MSHRRLAALGLLLVPAACSPSGAEPSVNDTSLSAAEVASSCAKTLIVTAAASYNPERGDVDVSSTLGFYDSAHDSDTKTFCYSGEPSGVCPLVEGFAAEHAISMASCVAANRIVIVKYRFQ